MARKTQAQAVLEWLETGAGIPSMEAFKQLGATRLSAIIFNLKRKGYNIETVTCEGTDRFGNPMRFARYYLRDSPVDSGGNVL